MEILKEQNRTYIICMQQQRGETGFSEDANGVLASTNVSTQETRGPSFRTQPKQNPSTTALRAAPEPGRPCTVVAQDRQTAHTKPNFATPKPHNQPPTPAHTPTLLAYTSAWFHATSLDLTADELLLKSSQVKFILADTIAYLLCNYSVIVDAKSAGMSPLTPSPRE